MEKNFCKSNCPIRKVMKILGGRGTLLILFSLKDSVKRYGEIKKEIPDLTEKVLIEKLKKLEEVNFIQRKNYNTIPPKVEYSLLDLGKESLELIPILASIGNKI